MGFSLCNFDGGPPGGFENVTSTAQHICPFPNYYPNPLFTNMLSKNSSLHLRDHYNAVQSSLTPKQLKDFTQSLRTTFGREGNVTHGSVGVVALSLAVLFDTLAREVKGELVPQSGPIPGLFVKDVRGYYPQHVHTISEYLRLMPYIANNPTRMKEEAGKYYQQLIMLDRSLKPGENGTLPVLDDTTVLNLYMAFAFTHSLKIHLQRLSPKAGRLPEPDMPILNDIKVNLNCDVTNKAFKRFMKETNNSNPEEYAKAVMTHAFLLVLCANEDKALLISQREGFDLKDNALGK